MVEISLNGGVTWSDVMAFGTSPGYTGPLANGNPLVGRPAYGGVSPGFPARSQVTLNFGTLLAGLSVQVRFRIASDPSVAAAGWNIDDIEVDGITNTPFPAFVPEPSTCTAKAPVSESAVVATLAAPATSLGAFDAAV
jgi:hypothetical protein